MKKGAKIAVSLLIFLCTVAVLLVTVVLITPWLIDQPVVGAKVRSEVSELVGGQFDFKLIDLSLFPTPHLVLVSPEINIPQRLTASAESIEIYPEIFSLLTGRLAFKETLLKRPEVTVTIPESTAGSKGFFSSPEIKQVMPVLFTKLTERYLPVNHAAITDGSMVVVYNDNTVFTLHNIQADLRNESKKTAIDFKLASSDVHLDFANKTADIKIKRLSGSFGFNTDSATIILSELLLDNPSMQVTGNFTVSEQDPKIHLQLEGRNIDIKSTRSAVLAIAGKKSITQTVFDIVKDGNIPLLTLSSQANTPDVLGNPDNLSVQIQIQNGDISIPGTDMDLTAVTGDIDISHGTLVGENIQARRNNSLVNNGILKLNLTKPPLPLHIEAEINADAADIPEILTHFIDDQPFKNKLNLIHDVKGNAEGKLVLDGDTSQLKVDVSATDINFAARYHTLPHLLSITDGSVVYDGARIQWRQLGGSLGTSSFAASSGNLDLGKTTDLGETTDFEITSGTVHIVMSEFLPLISQNIQLPAWLKIRPYPVTISHLSYSSHEKRNLTAILDFPDGLKISSDLSFEKLVVKDGASDVTLGGTLKDQMLDVSFDGILHESTLGQLFHVPPDLSGSVKGKAQIRLNLENPYDFSFDGELDGENLHVPLNAGTPLTVNTIAVQGAPKTITLKSADLFWSDMELTLSGTITPGSAEFLQIDLDAVADSVDVEKILGHFGNRDESQDQESAIRSLPLPVKGDIRFKARELKTKAFSIQPLQADIRLQDNTADITLKEAGLCGIQTFGTIRILPQSFEFLLRPEAQGLQLNTAVHCFADKYVKIDGEVDMEGVLEGVLEGRGTLKELFKASSGNVNLRMSDGQVYNDIILLEIVKFFNVSELLKDRKTSDEIKREGFGFKRFETQFTLKEGKLQYEKIMLDGYTLMLTGTGVTDILRKEVDFTVLVAPHKTTNTILSHIPLIGGILQTISTIPLSVKGPFGNIRVLPLAPSAVGYELKEIMKQIFGLPIKLVHIDNFHETMKNVGNSLH